MDKEKLQQIEQMIGYEFSDRTLLAKAFTHSSTVENRFLSNERLEFFGDSILALVICQTIFERFPDHLEGDLTKLKSMLVSRKTCSKIAKQLGLHKFLQISKGMSSTRALTGSLAAGLFEAVIAAIYIDGGFGAVSNFLLKHFDSLINESDAKQLHGNFKSLLQQHSQQKLDTTPVYQLLDEKGPDHDKCFETEVVIDDRHFPSAWGMNKKESEQKAAFNALVTLGVLKKSDDANNDDI